MRRAVKKSPVFVVFMLCASVCLLMAQKEDRKSPWFSLSISDYRHDWRGPGMYRLQIGLTNISNEPRHSDGCAVLRGLYTTMVAHNGIRIEERNGADRRRREAEIRRAYCKLDLPGRIPPGHTSYDYLLIGGTRFDMSKPGKYEITVSRETDPDHPDQSTTVTSNTLVILVPNETATTPK